MSGPALEGLRPAAELAKGKPHGTRIRYMGGCRCLPCRAANSRYVAELEAEARRTGRARGIVDAGRARRKIVRLGHQGIGYKRVAELAGVAASVVGQIRMGRKTRIRATTEQKILKVKRPKPAPHALVDAAEGRAIVDRLLSAGWKKVWISRATGGGDRYLSLFMGDRMLFRKLEALRRLEKLDGQRRKLVARGWTAEEIAEELGLGGAA